MTSKEPMPADIIVNGTRSSLLPSPPSTVSSIATPGWPIFPQPPRTNNNKKKKQKKRRQQRPHSAPVSPLQQSTALAPRPAQDLLVERSYLVDSLASQGARAADLIQRLSVAEQTAAAGEGGRRLRKQIALLRNRIAAAADQEKAVIVRLGELYVEMQSRERWARARSLSQSQTYPFQGGCFPIMPPGAGVPFAAPGPGPEQVCISTDLHPPAAVPLEGDPLQEVSIRTGLSPLSPEFVPVWAQGGNPWPMHNVPVPSGQGGP